MNIAKDLYKLQGVDQEITSDEQTYRRLSSQLGESEDVIKTRNKLESEKKRLEETVHDQRIVEWEIDDISTRLAKFEEELYSGRTTSPKELSSLQHEIDVLKAKRTTLEDSALESMETVEELTVSISRLEATLKELENEWQVRQKELTAELKKLEADISGLKEQREIIAGEFDPQVMEVYNEIRKRRGTSVAKVEQGICRGCRISLPVNELQQVRSGGLVRCSSCGRILFLA